MSHTAIAAVLARDDLSIGERLAALSLASYANREHRAFPGNAAAAARAGLSRSRYLEAREQLLARSLIAVEEAGRGRGQTTTLTTLFAQFGPWWDADINAGLLEHVLAHSRARGAARALLATLAALADDTGAVEDVGTEELCRAAGLADSTYRRARSALLASGEVELVEAGGGRGRLNRWQVRAADAGAAAPASAPRRRRPPVPGARPLLATVRDDAHVRERVAEVDDAAGTAENRPVLTGVSERKGPALTGVSGRKGPILNGVSLGKSPVLTGVSTENPAETPPQTPPPYVRAGREPLNPGIKNPPNPPAGESTPQGLFVEETFRTPRGRTRRRQVPVDVNAVCADLTRPDPADDRAWRRMRQLMSKRLGESMFEIWLAPIELRAVDDEGTLILVAPKDMRSWVDGRYRRVVDGAAQEVGRRARIAAAVESAAILAAPPAVRSAGAQSDDTNADAPLSTSADTSYDTSTCALSYTSAYNLPKEVHQC
ncbi:MAG: DnaA N-terminal domain-containing protein [Solirubrobacteraceae bacterium]